MENLLFWTGLVILPVLVGTTIAYVHYLSARQGDEF